MPCPPQLDAAVLPAPIAPSSPCTGDWRAELPTLTGSMVMLRELRRGDGPALFAALSSQHVSHFISPPPADVQGFEQFIAWSQRQRGAGQYLSFAVVPKGSDTPVGLFQIRSLEPAFGTSEWGFAIAEEFWGAGIFMDGAKLTVDFAFNVVGVRRLEARACVKNGRGMAALRKLGAVQEGVLRGSFLRHGQHHDQAVH